MEKIASSELDQVSLELMQYNGVLAITGFLALGVTIIFSFKKGGFTEVLENTFLWFLLFGGIFYFSSLPVDENDQMTGAMLFIAFGLCRIAKNIVKVTRG